MIALAHSWVPASAAALGGIQDNDRLSTSISFRSSPLSSSPKLGIGSRPPLRSALRPQNSDQPSTSATLRSWLLSIRSNLKSPAASSGSVTAQCRRVVIQVHNICSCICRYSRAIVMIAPAGTAVPDDIGIAHGGAC